MDFSIRCNSLKCRAQLADQAVVTTCSHIFCLNCADTLGLSSTNRATRTCPACNTHLLNQDDAAVTNLSPTEDYKTSVLSGLTPATIIECASRAMAFWSYQTTQEIFYQEFLMKSMTEKYQGLSGQMDKLISDANSEVSTIQLDNKDLESKNAKLAEAYNKKCKDNGQLHKLYQQAKQRQVNEMIAEAAEVDANGVVHGLEKQSHITPNDHMSGMRVGSSKRHSGEMRMSFGTGSLNTNSRTSQGMPAQSLNRSQIGTPIARHSLFMGGPNILDRDDRQRDNSSAASFRQPLGHISANVSGNSNLDYGRVQLDRRRQQQKSYQQSPTGLFRRPGGSMFRA